MLITSVFKIVKHCEHKKKKIKLNANMKLIAGVFYCGAPAPTKELKNLALDFSRKTTTKFDFHKENF